jgi:hypothetical protein
MTYAYAATQAFTASSNKWVDGGGRAGWGGDMEKGGGAHSKNGLERR